MITAKRRFVPGPAKMTSTFFHVLWRQYASAPRPSGELIEALLGAAPRHPADVDMLQRLGERRQLAARAFHVALVELALDSVDRRHQLRGLFERRPEEGAQVRRRRPVHSRDLHVAAERDRADAVLDALALDLGERRRKTDVEAPRAHADRSRGEEVARLVDEDEQAQADDRDEDVHGTSAPTACSARRRASPSASMSSSRSPAGAPSDGCEGLLDHAGDPEERQPAGQERGHGDLVRGVVGARIGSAGLSGLACESEQWETSRHPGPRTRGSGRS